MSGAGCILTHVGHQGQAYGSFAADFPWAFSKALSWVGRERRAWDQSALELRCHETGTLYRIRAKRPANLEN